MAMELSDLRQAVANIKLRNPSWGRHTIANEIGEKPSRVKHALRWYKKHYQSKADPCGENQPGQKVKSEYGDESATVEFTMPSNRQTPTKEEVQEHLNSIVIDHDLWEIEKYSVSSWSSSSMYRDQDLTWTKSQDKDGHDVQIMQGHSVREPRCIKTWNHSIKAKLRRKDPQVTALEVLIDEMKANNVTFPKVKYIKREGAKRDLEISLTDIHMGMKSFKPGSNNEWDIDIVYNLTMNVIERLLSDSKPFGPFNKIVFLLGSDLMHADNYNHTTTKGTPQPEMLSYSHVYLKARKLLIAMVERLRLEAPVKVLVIPGNHDRQSSFTLGVVVDSWFHTCEDVEVDCEPTTYKFHRAGYGS